MDGEEELERRRICLICAKPVQAESGRLCREHLPLAVLWSLLATGDMSDWFPNTGGCVNHREMQTMRLPDDLQPRAWWIVVGDINRMARMWLDGWHGDDECGVAA